MSKIEGTCREVLEQTEWLAIGTSGQKGVHLVGTWGAYVRTLGIEEDSLRIPVGGYKRTELDLKENGSLEILCATMNVPGTYSDGQGFRITGKARIETEGKSADITKEKFPWARGVLIVEPESITALC